MRFLALVLSCIASLASAQVASPPQCGVNTLVNAISNSGCSITDTSCLCKNQQVINDLKKNIPKKCTKVADQETYAAFLNADCVGYPGFPISFNETTSDARANRAGLGFMAVAAGLALL